MAGFRMLDGETLAGLLENYAQVANRTEELVAQLPDLDAAHPLPPAPWFEPGARWSARRVLLHVIGETASTPAMPTSSASLWTAPNQWDSARRRQSVDTTYLRQNSGAPRGASLYPRRSREGLEGCPWVRCLTWRRKVTGKRA